MIFFFVMPTRGRVCIHILSYQIICQIYERNLRKENKINKRKKREKVEKNLVDMKAIKTRIRNITNIKYVMWDYIRPVLKAFFVLIVLFFYLICLCQTALTWHLNPDAFTGCSQPMCDWQCSRQPAKFCSEGTDGSHFAPRFFQIGLQEFCLVSSCLLNNGLEECFARRHFIPPATQLDLHGHITVHPLWAEHSISIPDSLWWGTNSVSLCPVLNVTLWAYLEWLVFHGGNNGALFGQRVCRWHVGEGEEDPLGCYSYYFFFSGDLKVFKRTK